MKYLEFSRRIVPENPAAGLIFYPGATVQFESYAPLMQKCAEVRIEGGCYAYFGCYGFQEGDGTSTISNIMMYRS